MCEEQIHEVFARDGCRLVLRRNPVRRQELQEAREQESAWEGGFRREAHTALLVAATKRTGVRRRRRTIARRNRWYAVARQSNWRIDLVESDSKPMLKDQPAFLCASHSFGLFWLFSETLWAI